MKFLTMMLFAVVLFGQGLEITDQSKYDKELVQAQKIVRQYQHKFLMDDIVIGINVVPQDQLPNGSCGLSIWRVSNKFGYGTILILRRDEYNKPKHCQALNPKMDQKNTVIHEMGHFILRYANDEEMAISIYTNAFVPYRPPKTKKVVPPKKPLDPNLTFDDYPKHGK